MEDRTLDKNTHPSPPRCNVALRLTLAALTGEASGVFTGEGDIMTCFPWTPNAPS